MKARIKDFPLTVEEIRQLMKREESKKWTYVAVGVGVITALIALIVWVAKRREKDFEEHYEYFEDDFEDLDEDFDEFDESIYDDEEKIEYVKLKDFINDEEEIVEDIASDEEVHTETEASKEVEDK